MISRWTLLKMINISHGSCRENHNTNRRSCRLCDNVENYCRSGRATSNNIIRRMRLACWIPETTNTHSEYAVLIAFRRQYWLRERTGMPRYTYEACPESIQPFWMSREPVSWPWGNLAASQRRPYCASVISLSSVGLVSRQWDAVDWACVLCDRRIHKSPPFQRRFKLWEKPEFAGSQLCAVGGLTDLGVCYILDKERGKLIANTSREEDWPVRKCDLVNKYLKQFTMFTHTSLTLKNCREQGRKTKVKTTKNRKPAKELIIWTRYKCKPSM